MNEIATQELTGKTGGALEEARALEIETPDHYEGAAVSLKMLTTLRNEIITHYKDSKEKAHAAHSAVCAAEKKHLDPVKDARNLISRKMGAWDHEQEQKRREEQRRADEAARKAAEEQQLADAEAAEAAGDKETAEAILEEETHAVAPVVEKATPKITGVHTTVRWSAEVVNFKELVGYVHKDPTQLGLLQANQSALNGLARSQKTLFAIPGVKAVPVRTAGTRGV